jgi:hypothetical protein
VNIITDRETDALVAFVEMEDARVRKQPCAH